MSTPSATLLFRGDSDSKDIRKLRATPHHHQLQTNLLDGGTGYDIYYKPLINLIKNHIHPGRDKSHFLSFSEDERIAHRFGLHCEIHEVDEKLLRYEELADHMQQ